MDKIEETRGFLDHIGMPKAQQADICCYVILAMAGIKPDMQWKEATNEWIRIHDIIQFANSYYGTTYAENSRETFRKQALHHFRTAALVEDNGKATNSPNYRYRLTKETFQLLRVRDTMEWEVSLRRFQHYHPTKLGFEITLHDKMPDVVLYREDKDWLYFVESVTSVGPMDPKRILEITEMTKDVTAGKIFVTAFPDFKTYKKFSEKLAWETEVWIAEMPEHMIHLDGDKFLGPR